MYDFVHNETSLLLGLQWSDIVHNETSLLLGLQWPGAWLISGEEEEQAEGCDPGGGGGWV